MKLHLRLKLKFKFHLELKLKLKITPKLKSKLKVKLKCYIRLLLTFSKATDEAVITDNTVVKTKVSSLTPGLLNVVSLSRGQIHSKSDRMCDIMYNGPFIGRSGVAEI